MRKLLENSIKFINWKRDLRENGVILQSYDALSLVPKRDGSILFAMLRAKMRAEDGVSIPDIVVLRGNFVAVLIHLLAEDTKKDFTILVKQRRVATGGYFYEFPAGMTDENTDIYDVAIKEVREETGLNINKRELILLTPEPYFSSPGLLDEAGYYFAYKIQMKEKDILQLAQKNLGNKSERENIETIVVELNQAHKLIRNAHTMLHLLLYINQIG